MSADRGPERHYRFEDMSVRGRLVLLQQRDGDMIVEIITDTGESSSVEFCASGGQSYGVRRALESLMEAIRLENINNPQSR